MRHAAFLTLAAALFCAACSSRPRSFAPRLAAEPTDQQAFDAAWQAALDGRSLDLAGKARLQLASSHVPIAAAEAERQARAEGRDPESLHAAAAPLLAKA